MLKKEAMSPNSRVSEALISLSRENASAAKREFQKMGKLLHPQGLWEVLQDGEIILEG